FDEVASMLRLGIPGGPSVLRLARDGDRQGYALPRAMIDDDKYQTRVSGRKTADRYAIDGQDKDDFNTLDIDDQKKANVCASVEAAVVDCLVSKAVRAVKRFGLHQLCVGGGVAVNPRLRNDLEQAAARGGFTLNIAPPELCTDNAVMGAIGWEKV